MTRATFTIAAVAFLCSTAAATSPQARIADSSSRNAVNFSSACTTKRRSSPRCASAIQIVRLLESIADTQPQLHPALLRLSAMISQYFTLVYLSRQSQNVASAKRPPRGRLAMASLSPFADKLHSTKQHVASQFRNFSRLRLVEFTNVFV